LTYPISRLEGNGITLQNIEITPQTDSESWHRRLKDASEDNKWMIVQCGTISKSLNPWNIN